jgi:hypothetical protein
LPKVIYFIPETREIIDEFTLLEGLKPVLATFAIDLKKHTTLQQLGATEVRVLTPELHYLLKQAREIAMARKVLAVIPPAEGVLAETAEELLRFS